MSKAYVVADIEVQDPAAYERYKELSSAAVDAYGGRWLVRGGHISGLEGEWAPSRLVIIEFDDEAAAQRWYDSPQYAEAREVRQAAARSSMLVVTGV